MFRHRWADLLNKPPRLTAKGLKKLLRASRNNKRIECFASVIKECGLVPVATHVPNRAYFPAIAELEALRVELDQKGIDDVVSLNDVRRLKNSWHLGFWGVAILLSIIAEDRRVQPGTLEVIYDYNKDEHKKLEDGYEIFVETASDLAKYFRVKPYPEDDETFMPLQAADLLAWHMHRDHLERAGGRRHEDTIWEILRTSPHIAEIEWTGDMVREAFHIDELRKQHLS
jgi:hypothetical protein